MAPQLKGGLTAAILMIQLRRRDVKLSKEAKSPVSIVVLKYLQTCHSSL